MVLVGNLTVRRISVGKLPAPCVGTLQVPRITEICRNFAYASIETVVTLSELDRIFWVFFDRSESKQRIRPIFWIPSGRILSCGLFSENILF